MNGLADVIALATNFYHLFSKILLIGLVSCNLCLQNNMAKIDKLISL